MENTLSLKTIQKTNKTSELFRNFLIFEGFTKFDGSTLKGELCYDAYYKDIEYNANLKYTIYCYCYDLKEITKNPELFEFSFESQIESEFGIIGFETIQWDFTTIENGKQNLEYFKNKLELIWKELGSRLFNPN